MVARRAGPRATASAHSAPTTRAAVQKTVSGTRISSQPKSPKNERVRLVTTVRRKYQRPCGSPSGKRSGIPTGCTVPSTTRFRSHHQPPTTRAAPPATRAPATRRPRGPDPIR